LNTLKPIISVVLPLYNAANYIGLAVDSILKQSLTNFELIIIDDCSTDGSFEIVNQIVDSRINLIRNKSNLGLNSTLNYALSLAKGKYIARMDHDDISLPNRFEIQVDFLEKNLDYILVGCNCDVIDGAGKVYINSSLKKFDDNYLKSILFFACPFVHPSIMIRRSILDQYSINYNQEIKQAEDYVLYCTIAKFGKFFSASNVLFQYREHISIDRGTSSKNKNAIIQGRFFAWRIILDQFNINPSNEVLQLHDKLCYYHNEIDISDYQYVNEYLLLLKNLKSLNNNLNIYNKYFFNQNISNRCYSMSKTLLEKKAIGWNSLITQFPLLSLNQFCKILIFSIKN